MMHLGLSESKKFVLMVAIFLFFYLVPFPFRTTNPLTEALLLLQWYAREHVLLCLIPAFFIAGAIAVVVSQAAVLKYFGHQANKILSYCVASVSGTILAVCSCTVLPLFAGIYRRGGGLGPATAFLYSGPAINVLAIIMTARILGWKLGLARAICAVFISILVGLLMHFIFLKEEREREEAAGFFLNQAEEKHSLGQTSSLIFSLVAFLVLANWAEPKAGIGGFWAAVASVKWLLSGLSLLGLFLVLKKWYAGQEIQEWGEATWGFARQITPLLFLGVFIAGLFLGRPGQEGLIPSRLVVALVGGNSFRANLFASLVAAFMYFATLTEVPILQGLLGSGMGQGPALALLLAGPALSLPSMLVLRSIIGTRKTVVYVILVVVVSTISGMVFGHLTR
ncbi:MAG: permease [Candidatus Omnitrophica bacterium]|nr:permease [Candidatus Omnitrophota bacterium]